MFVEVNKDGFITGYSTEPLFSNGIGFYSKELPSDFQSRFSFYRLDSDLSIIYDDTRIKEVIEEQERLDAMPTKEEMLEQAIQHLSEEKAILKKEILEARQRSEMTEEALLDLASMLISL